MILFFRRMLPVLIAGSIFFHLSAFGQAWTIFNDANSMLPQNTIRCIAVDAQNRKWVGTDWGLGVYNDTAWTVYNTANSGIPDNSIRSIAFDAAGNVWLGTFNNGAVKYNGTTWTVFNSINSGLPSNFVKGIAFDTLDEPWFATAGALAHFNGSAWQEWDMNNSPLLSPNIACIAVGSNNMKYLGTFNGGFYNFDGDTTWQVFNHIVGTLPDNSVLSIALDSVGTRWLAMPAQGIIALDDVAPPQWSSTSNSLIPTNAIVHIMVDSLQKKYLCSQDEGFIIYDGILFTKYNSFNSPMPDDYTLCTAKDHNGILWVGTYNGGLVRVDESQLTGVSEASENSLLSIYPNPATKELRISDLGFRIDAVVIYDALGQRVLSLAQASPSSGGQQPAASSQQPVSIDVSSLTPGVYSIEIIAGDRKGTGRFVKQ